MIPAVVNPHQALSRPKYSTASHTSIRILSKYLNKRIKLMIFFKNTHRQSTPWRRSAHWTKWNTFRWRIAICLHCRLEPFSVASSEHSIGDSGDRMVELLRGLERRCQWVKRLRKTCLKSRRLPFCCCWGSVGDCCICVVKCIYGRGGQGTQAGWFNAGFIGIAGRYMVVMYS